VIGELERLWARSVTSIAIRSNSAGILQSGAGRDDGDRVLPIPRRG